VPDTVPVLGVSVRLVDSIGRIWAQHDYETLGSANANCELRITRCRAIHPGGYAIHNTNHANQSTIAWAFLSRRHAAGQYFVEVAVHPKGDARPLDVLALDGGRWARPRGYLI